MESIYFERLKDRDLWVDGVSSIHVDAICNNIFSGNVNFLENALISESAKDEVKHFAQFFNEKIPDKINVKTKKSINELDTSFNIPSEYLNMDIEKRIIRDFKKRHDLDVMENDEKEERLARIADELELYIKRGLMDVLKTASYIVDVLDMNNVVWGPGRGSACCSYILFLLNVHDIDSYYYDLPINEFLK